MTDPQVTTMNSVAAALAALRARDAQRHAPVRFHFIEALARRAALQDGAARAVLEVKLAHLLVDYQRRVDETESDAAQGAASAAAPPLAASPLADLLKHIAASTTLPVEGRIDGRVGDPASPPELKTLRDFRSTWSRLSIDLRLTPALAKVPENAGPLNSHMLALQSLKLMRELSPSYLDRFMSYLDALLWLDQVGGEAAPAARDGGLHMGDKSRKRSRRGSG